MKQLRFKTEMKISLLSLKPPRAEATRRSASQVVSLKTVLSKLQDDDGSSPRRALSQPPASAAGPVPQKYSEPDEQLFKYINRSRRSEEVVEEEI